jgi:hypothetical protein
MYAELTGVESKRPAALENSEIGKSDKFLNFDQAMRTIMTMPGSEAKRIRDKYSPKARKRKKPKP